MANGWTRPPTQFTEDVLEAQRERMRRAVLIAMRGVVLRTPVGNTALWKTKYPPAEYVGGRARANWQLTKGAPATGELELVDESGSDAIGEASNAAPQAFDTWYLTNNVPYAERLEHGWSSQAPSGMVSVTLLELVEQLG